MGTKIVVIGVGTQGSMIAFRNAVYGKEVVGYSRSEASRQQCRARVGASCSIIWRPGG